MSGKFLKRSQLGSYLLLLSLSVDQTIFNEKEMAGEKGLSNKRPFLISYHLNTNKDLFRDILKETIFQILNNFIHSTDTTIVTRCNEDYYLAKENIFRPKDKSINILHIFKLTFINKTN